MSRVTSGAVGMGVVGSLLQANENAPGEESQHSKSRLLGRGALALSSRLVFRFALCPRWRRRLSAPILKSCTRDKMAAATSRYYSEGGRATKRQKTDSDGMTTVYEFNHPSLSESSGGKLTEICSVRTA